MRLNDGAIDTKTEPKVVAIDNGEPALCLEDDFTHWLHARAICSARAVFSD